MNELSSSRTDWFRKLWTHTDWFLLLFLLGFCVDSVVVKPAVMALALVGMWQALPRLNYKDTPWFYLALPAMEILRYLIFSRDFSAGHTATVIIGSAYWIMAWLAFLIVRHRVSQHRDGQTIATMELWFVLNFIWSLVQLGETMATAHSINPYALEDPLYGNSTGDYIKGLFLAPCYLNMFVNSFFAIWFLYRRKWGLALLASLICCLTTTNFANIVFLPVLLGLLFVLRTRAARLTILGSIAIFAAFYVLIASGNIKYLSQSVNNTSGTEINQPATTPDDNKPGVDSVELARVRAAAILGRLSHPNGKVMSWKQTAQYLGTNPVHLIFGAGMGNFSSLVALQMAHVYGRKHSRFYERMPTYIHPDYETRHFAIMRDLYDLPDEYHSARHMPHSFPNQLLGEYGLLGGILFLVGYVWYFLKRGAAKGYFLVILLLTAGYLWFDYLFEYLSIMVFFELFFWQFRQHQTSTRNG